MPDEYIDRLILNAKDGKGELKKKIYEILDKHFPNLNTAEER